MKSAAGKLFAVCVVSGLTDAVKDGLVRDPGDWQWSGFRRYVFREMGVVEIESEWTARGRAFKVTGSQPRAFLCPG